MGKLSTHVLDTQGGHPAAGVSIELWALSDGEKERLVVSTETNSDGRTDAPLLSGESVVAGNYRLIFNVAEYYQRQGNRDAGRFLNRVPVEFKIEDPSAGYHVPLLVTPWSYTTYRGS